jgi:hypothetical protein
MRIDPDTGPDLAETICALQQQLTHFDGIWICLHGIAVQGAYRIVIPNALLDLSRGEHVPWTQKPLHALPNTTTGSLLAAPSIDIIADHYLPDAHLLQALVFGRIDWLSSLWQSIGPEGPLHAIPTHIAIVGHPDLVSTNMRSKPALETHSHILRSWLNTTLCGI